jgi:hypothetical protein
VQAGEALFFRTQMKLRKERAILQCRRRNAFSQSGHGFGYESNALLVWWGKKKWAEKAAM